MRGFKKGFDDALRKLAPASETLGELAGIIVVALCVGGATYAFVGFVFWLWTVII